MRCANEAHQMLRMKAYENSNAAEREREREGPRERKGDRSLWRGAEGSPQVIIISFERNENEYEYYSIAVAIVLRELKKLWKSNGKKYVGI